MQAVERRQCKCSSGVPREAEDRDPGIKGSHTRSRWRRNDATGMAMEEADSDHAKNQRWRCNELRDVVSSSE
jgi:hypothetical protein